MGRLDDAALPDGTYEVRAHLRDGAGNERTADRRRDGSPMLVSLPARAVTRIVLGERRRCKRLRGGRARCTRDRGPVRGNGVTVRGELRAGDRPLVHSPIVVLTAPRNGGPLSRAATVVTDAAGRFSFGTGVGPSRTVRFAYDGTRVTRPALAEVRVLVRARSSIAVDRRFALNGAGGPVPTGGWCGGRFPMAASSSTCRPSTAGGGARSRRPARIRAGRWSYDYRFEATTGVVTYRFRARIRREAAYPYELGRSRVVRVTVRG